MPKIPGPPPEPTSLAEARQRRSHRPSNASEPRLSAGEPAVPYFLGELDAAHIGRLLEGLTVDHLKQQAKALAIPRYSRLRREDLLAAIARTIPGPRKKAWEYLFATIEPMNVITPQDGAAFAMAVEALVEYIEITRALETEGRFWKTSGRYGDQVKRHPGIDAQGKAWNRFQTMLDRFGANPAYRAKVQIAANAAAGAPVSPWDALDFPAAGDA